VLPHVEVQGMYLGSDWYNYSTYYNQTAQFENFNRFLPQSSYMDMLTQLGYGVGRGSTSPGTIDTVTLNKNYYLTDSGIRNEIQRYINAGYLQQPDVNRLYVVYVEPGVAILNDHDNNSTSTRNFAGYHGAFGGRTAYGYAADIHYAVIAYASSPNGGFPGLTPFGTMTLTASHEIAEAATDPNVNYRGLGWYDDYYNSEIGDIHRYEALLNGYAIQSLISKNDVAYIPAGATILRPIDPVSAFASTAGHTSAAAGQNGQAHQADVLFALLARNSDLQGGGSVAADAVVVRSATGRADSAGHTAEADVLFSLAGSQLLPFFAA
jgi:hypothetical protein